MKEKWHVLELVVAGYAHRGRNCVAHCFRGCFDEAGLINFPFTRCAALQQNGVQRRPTHRAAQYMRRSRFVDRMTIATDIVTNASHCQQCRPIVAQRGW